MVATFNTPDDVAILLGSAEFVFEDRRPAGAALIGAAPTDWWTLGDDQVPVRARFVATRDDGHDLYAFTGPAQALAWRVHLSEAVPADVVWSLLERANVWALHCRALEYAAAHHEVSQ